MPLLVLKMDLFEDCPVVDKASDSNHVFIRSI